MANPIPESDFARDLKDIFAQVRAGGPAPKLPGVQPGLEGYGPYNAAADIAGGQATPETLLRDEQARLKQKHGEQNVLTVQRGNGEITGFEVREGPDKPWKPTQAGENIRAILRAKQAALLQDVDPNDSPGWGTRFLAGLKASPAGRLNFLRHRFGANNVHPLTNSSGELENVVIERPGQKPVLLDPQATDISSWLRDLPGDATADVSGDAIETAGGIAGAAGAARLGRGRGVSALIEGAGDLVGSAVRQSVSALIPGDDELTTTERLTMAGVNAGAGQIGNAAQGAASFAGRNAPVPAALGGKGFLPSTRAMTQTARDIASEAKQESLQSVTGVSVGDFTRRSLELQQRINATVQRAGLDPEKATFRFTGPQATGSKSAAKAWHVMAQTPEIGDELLREERRQLLNYSRYADVVIDHMAGDVSKLGNATVGDQVVGAVRRHVDGLVAQRAAVAGPLFRQADEMLRGRRVIPLHNTIETIDKLIAKYEADVGTDSSTTAVKALRRQRDELLGIAKPGHGHHGPSTPPKLPSVAEREFDVTPDGEIVGPPPSGAPTKDPKVTLGSLQRSLSIYGKAAAGSGNVVKDLDKATDLHIAKELFGALQKDLDGAAGFVGGEASEAGKLLQKARGLWRDHSTLIDEATNSTVVRLLKLEGEPTTEKIVGKIMGMGKHEIAGLMRIVEKTDPVAGQNLFAQALRNVFKEAGHGIETPGGADMATAMLSPQRLAELGKAYGEQLNALSAGSAKRQAELKNLFEAADRLAAGPGLRGAQTQPNQWTMTGIQKAMQGAPRELLAELQGVAVNAVQRGVFSPRSVYNLLLDPKGVETFNRLISTQLEKVESPKKAAQVAKRMVQAITQLTVLSQRDMLYQREPVDETEGQ
jgi:hypothetical protein